MSIACECEDCERYFPPPLPRLKGKRKNEKKGGERGRVNIACRMTSWNEVSLVIIYVHIESGGLENNANSSIIFFFFYF